MAASDKILRFRIYQNHRPEKKALPEVALDVTLKDVYFSYEEDREILKGISLNLPAGSLYHWLVNPDVVRVRLPESCSKESGI